MNRQPLNDMYGRCWAFPPHFSLEQEGTMAKGVTMVEGATAVRQSLKILFLTEPGERIMRDTLGCGLSDYLFHNINDQLMAQIETQINDSVLRYEPRVQMRQIALQQEKDAANTLHIQCHYRLRGCDIEQQIEGRLNMVNGQRLEVL